MNSNDNNNGEIFREAQERASGSKGTFDGIMDDVNALGRLFNRYKSGEYRGLSKLNIGLYAAGILYVLSPFDFIPEMFLSVVGLADDVGVLAFILFGLRKEIRKFKAWELEESFTNVTEVLESES